jgi:hypothetical protein
VLALIGAPSAALADELGSTAARPDYLATEKLLMSAARKSLENKGLTIDGTYTSDLFFTPQLDNRFHAGGLFTLELDVKKRFHLSAFGIHGDSPTAEIGDAFGVSGNTAPQDIRLFEAYHDQEIGPVTVRTGLIAADQELVIADRSSLLLAATFGITAQFSSNILGPVYPVAAPGISARVEKSPIGGRLAIYDGGLENRHGIPTSFGTDALAIGEIHFFQQLKLGAWHHTARGTAYYAVADSQLERDLGVFARVGHATSGRISTYIDAGLRMTPRRFRPQDLVGLGIAYARVEDGGQTMTELTYEIQYRWLSIQPTAQVMMLPDRTVLVLATRLTLTL